MKMEKVNANTIRVTLEEQDLVERGMTVLDLLGNPKEIEKFFYSILEEVDMDQQFNNTDAVTFQVIPKSNGLELFITKLNLDEKENSQEEYLAQSLDAVLDNISTLEEQAKDKDFPNDETEKIKEETVEENSVKQQTKLVSFADFEDFIALSKVTPLQKIKASLYVLDRKYYLLVSFNESTKLSDIQDLLALIYEYAQKERVSAELIHERAQLLRAQDALSWAREIFA